MVVFVLGKKGSPRPTACGDTQKCFFILHWRGEGGPRPTACRQAGSNLLSSLDVFYFWREWEQNLLSNRQPFYMSFPRKRESSLILWIPAFAGMTSLMSS